MAHDRSPAHSILVGWVTLRSKENLGRQPPPGGKGGSTNEGQGPAGTAGQLQSQHLPCPIWCLVGGNIHSHRAIREGRGLQRETVPGPSREWFAAFVHRVCVTREGKRAGRGFVLSPTCCCRARTNLALQRCQRGPGRGQAACRVSVGL